LEALTGNDRLSVLVQKMEPWNHPKIRPADGSIFQFEDYFVTAKKMQIGQVIRPSVGANVKKFTPSERNGDV
jgi:hypothetical protein